MAIDLYSNQYKEEPTWKKILFVISIILLLIVIGIFAYYNFVEIPKNEEISQSVKVELRTQGTSEQLSQKSMVLAAEKEINQFKDIYGTQHVFDEFFNEFEGWIYPRIYIYELVLDAEVGSVNLKVSTDSLQSLMQQMLLLDGKENIIDYTISNIDSTGDDVKFDLVLTLNSALFTKDYQTDE